MGEEPETIEEIIKVVDEDPEPAPDPEPEVDPEEDPTPDPDPEAGKDPDPEAGKDPGPDDVNAPAWASELQAGLASLQEKLTVREADDKEKAGRQEKRQARRHGYRADLRKAKVRKAASSDKRREPRVKLFRR